MPRDLTLLRAATETEAGDFDSLLRARRRLQGLVRTYPHDLEVRARLAAVYRRLGEPAEAGRWDYLSEERVPGETAAFERARPDAYERYRALAWPGRESEAPTRTAEGRLAELCRQADRDPRRLPRDAEDDAHSGGTWRDRLSAVGCATAVVLMALVFGVGVLVTVRHLIGLFG